MKPDETDAPLHWREDQMSDENKSVLLYRAARAGNEAAAFDLANIYMRGEGVPQSDDIALYWWKKAAELGSWDAPFYIGWMYEHGRGTEQNYAEAAKWYRQVAENTPFVRPTAVYNLARMYHLGLGVEKDASQALHWYQVAATQRNGAAELALGRMFQQGDGVDQDDDEAAMWYSRCADRVPEAAYQLGLLLHGTATAFRHLLFAANEGLADAMLEVARRYATGLGTAASKTDACGWYQRAIDAGNADAAAELAKFLTDAGAG